jgi:hypothetical protein
MLIMKWLNIRQSVSSNIAGKYQESSENSINEVIDIEVGKVVRKNELNLC